MSKKIAKKDSRSQEKARVELRFEQNVMDKLQSVANESQITVNQLLQGLSKKFISHVHSGEPRRDEKGKVRNKPQIGCVWFGKTGTRPDFEDEHIADCEQMSIDEYERRYLGGEIWLELDFTERKVVKRDL